MKASFMKVSFRSQKIRCWRHALQLRLSAKTGAIPFWILVCAVTVGLLLFSVPVVLAQEIEEGSGSDYEISAGYGSTFLSDGNAWAQSFEVAVARRFFSDHSGLELRFSHQRAVEDEMRDAVLGGWTDSRAHTADLAFYADALRFWTGVAGHRLRFRAGPSLQKLNGENFVLLSYPAFVEKHPEAVDEMIESGTFDNVYRVELYGDDLPQEGPYVLFTNDREGVRLGAMLGLSYSIEWWRLVLGLEAGAHVYSGDKMYGYGLNVGVKW